MSTYTNNQWLVQLAADVDSLRLGTMTQAQFVTAMQTYTDGWIGIAAADSVLANLVSTTVTNIVLRDSDVDAWAYGTVTGGDGAGNYTIHTLAGGTVVVPCIAKLLQLVTHGADAQTGLTFSIIGPFNNNELLQIIAPPGPLVIAPASVSGWCRVLPTASTTFPIFKNGSAWGTVTFGAGSHNAVTASFSSNNIARGDGAELFAPAIVDATLADFSITIPGN
jgi:hypothetical protein